MLNNLVADNIHSQIKQNNEITQKDNNRGILFFSMVTLISLAITFLTVFENFLYPALALTIAVFACVELLNCFTKCNNSPWIFNEKKLINKNKAELHDYLSQPNVQLELLKFLQPKFYSNSIYNLKKLLVLKQYSNVTGLVETMFNSLIQNEQEILENTRINQMVVNYENNLKFSSKAKLTLVKN